MAVTPEVALGVALLAAAASIVSVVITSRSQVRLFRMQAQLNREQATEARAAEAAKILAKFRDPLIRAAYDLQSRLYNIITRNFIGAYFSRGTSAERGYVLDNTCFLIAQYLGWMEIIRHEIQFLDRGDIEETRSLSKLQDTITHLWLTDRHDFGHEFRIFAGEQRALGERMINVTSRGLECLGYAGFLDALKTSSFEFPFVEKLREDIAAFEESGRQGESRLVALQHALIDLLEFLDPDYIRFPLELRTKVTPPVRSSPTDHRQVVSAQ